MLNHLTEAYQNLKFLVQLGKVHQAFKIKPVNLKSRSPRTSLKIKITQDFIKNKTCSNNCLLPQHFYLWLQNILTKTDNFYTNVAVI